MRILELHDRHDDAKIYVVGEKISYFHREERSLPTGDVWTEIALGPTAIEVRETPAQIIKKLTGK